MPSDDWYNSIHERLLSGDPTAPAELAENILDILIKKLTSKYHYLNDPEIIFDAVSDALLSYIKNPKQFNPSKRGLLGYLQMASEGDLRNSLAKEKRRQEKEILSEDVELTSVGGNILIKGGFSHNAGISVDYEHGHKRVQTILNDLFNDPKDLKMAALILQGERSTATYVELLGLEGISVNEQRREVKRHKDRIKKRIERYLKGEHEK